MNSEERKMLCKEIIEVLERVYPKQAALEWDNVGLLVGRTDKNVEKILVALDATDEVNDEAIEKGIDMIVTHHPLLFSPLKKITDENLIGNRVVKLSQHDIPYYAMHTNYDILGMADLSGNVLGLNDMEALSEEGVGRVGYLEKACSLEACCELVKERFQLDNVKVFGDIKSSVNRVAISPGSGKHMSSIALQKGAQVLVTGDIDHHEGIDAVAQGLAIIDAGHYGLEHIFIEDISNYLMKHTDVSVEKEKIVHPFQVV